MEQYVAMVETALAFLRAYRGPVEWIRKLGDKARANPRFVPTDKDVVRLHSFVAQIRKNGREEAHLHALPDALA